MEVTIDGVQYKTSKLDAFTQLHVARRLVPVLPGFIATILKADLDKVSANEAFILAAGPVGQSFAMMPQDDVDYIVRACLSVCGKVQGDKLAPLMAPNGRLMFEAEMTLQIMIRLSIEVIKENLGNFLPVRETKT